MIYGLAAKAGGGKDTAADFLIDFYRNNQVDVVKYSFADPLKAFTNSLFNWGKRHAEGDLKEVVTLHRFIPEDTSLHILKHFANHPTNPITVPQAKKLADILIQNLQEYLYQRSVNTEQYSLLTSPRKMYQFVGTELFRECVSKSFWTDLAIDFCKDKNVVIPDVRMPNESNFVREYGVLLHIEGRMKDGVPDHISEHPVGVEEGDIVIQNTGTLDEFRDNVVKSIATAKWG